MSQVVAQAKMRPAAESADRIKSLGHAAQQPSLATSGIQLGEARIDDPRILTTDDIRFRANPTSYGREGYHPLSNCGRLEYGTT